MTQQRKTSGGDRAGPAERRPLSARSVIASTLLGMRPPRLDTVTLVRSGELFGIAEGTTRVAISRMVAAGELEGHGGGYHLAGTLVARQSRQDRSRSGAPSRRWHGGWHTAVVNPGARTAEDRNALRRAMADLRLAELRDGVWMRPDNLDLLSGRSDGSPSAPATVAARQCVWFNSRVADSAVADIDLAAVLWDLQAWAEHARRLLADMDDLSADLRRQGTGALAPAFEVSASVLRHFQADPLLPDEVLAADWPGSVLRATYEEYDGAFKTVWRQWFGQHRAPS